MSEVVPRQDALVDQARYAVWAGTTPKIFPNMLLSSTDSAGFSATGAGRLSETSSRTLEL